MTYKIKSFLYFLCFAIAAFIYNNIEQKEQEFQNEVNSASIVETDFEDVDDIKETQEDPIAGLE
ncbi:hypothetical protein [Flagellimonas sp.]|uniref:hypothetical protein n=1 Tax=Flagellimonas sp. TaxID=2058762 RepID=UPI003B502A7B